MNNKLYNIYEQTTDGYMLTEHRVTAAAVVLHQPKYSITGGFYAIPIEEDCNDNSQAETIELQVAE